MRVEVQGRVLGEQELQEEVHQNQQRKGTKDLFEGLQPGTRGLPHMQEDMLRQGQAVCQPELPELPQRGKCRAEEVQNKTPRMLPVPCGQLPRLRGRIKGLSLKF